MRPISPTLGRTLNLASPLAKGLRDAVMFHGGYGRNYADPTAQPAFTGSPAVGQSWAGPGMKVASGTQYASYTPNYSFYNSPAYTVSFLYHVVSIPGDYTSLIELGTGGGVRMFSVFLNTAGNINYCVIEGDIVTISGTLGLTAGNTYRLTFVISGTAVSVYKNGLLSGTGTLGFRNNFSGSWYLGKNISGGGVEPNAIFNDLLVWPTRALTSDDVRLLVQDNEAIYRKAPTQRRGVIAGGTNYAADVSPQAYTYQSGTVDVARGRLADVAAQAYTYAAGAVDIGRTIIADVAALAYSYTARAVDVSYQPAATGDTHDGFLRRSRRERAIEAARRRAEEERLTERNALRLSLEAAMGMAAEVVEEAPDEAAEAVRAAVEVAAAFVPTLGRVAPALPLEATARALDNLQAAIAAAIRAKALADDDADVEILLRAL